MIKVGEHITLDIIGTTKEYEPSIYEKVIKDIAEAANVTILNIFKYKFEPQGFTILALLAESHISFHTFPEKGIVSFDFFTCGKISPAVAINIIKKGKMIKVGEHITLDIIGTTKEYDPSFYERVIHKIAKAANVCLLYTSPSPRDRG